MHDDSWGYDPCREPTSYWALDKPTVVGELPATSDYYTAEQMIACAEKNGFAGDLFWAYNDGDFPVDTALAPLASYAAAHADVASFAALVAYLAAPPNDDDDDDAGDDRACDDVAPDDQSTCAQQTDWGKCGESWMVGYCCATCFECDASCTGI